MTHECLGPKVLARRGRLSVGVLPGSRANRVRERTPLTPSPGSPPRVLVTGGCGLRARLANVDHTIANMG